ncbi:MAG: HDOD domain-containing protein [Pirellulales bacterium]|nr:HDOD domain-containing protein [Pirellulales bacterium]
MISSNKASPLEQVAARIEEISSLPDVAARVLEVVNDPKCGAAELKTVLESDPSLAARVLRCANSSAYALRTRVSNLQLAVAYLGFKQVRNLALTVTVCELFRQGESMGPYRRSDLWRHLVAVAVCARLIAMRQRLAAFEDAFLAGLLHDIGIILADQGAHDPFRRMMLSLSAGVPLVVQEQQALGFDHTELGEHFGQRWNFPEAVLTAIRYHHAADEYAGEHEIMLRCVELANVLCSYKGMTSVGMNLVEPSAGCLSTLGFNRHDVEVLMTDLDHELFTHAHLFSL